MHLFARYTSVRISPEESLHPVYNKTAHLCSVYTTSKVCAAPISMGAFWSNCISSTASLENTMSKMHNVAISTALIISALVLSACATNPQEAPVAAPAPAPVAATQEATPAPEAAPAPAPVVATEQPAPAVAAAQPAPKPVVKKAKKKVVKAAPPKAEPVAPVAAPAPVVKQEAPVAASAPQEAAPAVVVTPLPKAATPGFFEKYWMWLLGLIVAIIAILWMKKKD